MNFKPIQLKKGQKTIIYAVAAVLAVFLIERLFFAGLRAKIRNLNQQIKLEEANLKISMSMRKQKDKILSENNRYKTYLEITESTSEREIISKFLREVEKIADDSGISVINLSPENQIDKLKNCKKYNADLRAEGPGDKIFNFLNKIQSSNLLVEVDRFSIVSKDEQADSLRLETIISIVVPQLKDESS
ncbi:MAG: hypothetical protein PHG68_04315 [Candidatus Omnitrophica bacterium]|nr:hypothetical protein [Candidatus Omnitrophota bacterium]